MDEHTDEEVMWRAWAAGFVVMGWVLVGMVVFDRVWWKPLRLRRHYQKQGIRGPPFHPLLGNLMELRGITESVPAQASSLSELSMHRVAPELLSLCQKFGKVSVHEVGRKTRLLVAEVELAREVLSAKAAFYQKADMSRQAFWRLLGKGLVFLEGDFWRQQRRVVNTAFRHQYLKGFCKFMGDACEDLVARWNKNLEDQTDMKSGVGSAGLEIEVSREMSMLTLEVMSRALFGSHEGGSKHASDGAVAFECLSELFTSSMKCAYSYKRLFPGYSLFPTIDNWSARGREKFVNSLLENIIQSRMKKKEAIAEGRTVRNCRQAEEGEDILGVMLDALYEGCPTMSVPQLMHESKTLFFAGHATTSVVLTWCLALLSIHQDWQEKARKEIHNVFESSAHDGTGAAATTPHIQLIGKLKIVGMILNETLRLYPPVSILSRKCMKAHHIGSISVLPGTLVVIPTVLFHQSEELWGADVGQFNPERFENKEGKDLPGFMPFGGGPRTCLGINFAIAEVKIVLSMLLRNFSFSLSPTYLHAPGLASSMRPQFGLPLIVTKLQP